MNLNKRIYQKIMNYLNKNGHTLWDFRTLNLTHPQLCTKLIEILSIEYGFTYKQLMSHYVPNIRTIEGE